MMVAAVIAVSGSGSNGDGGDGRASSCEEVIRADITVMAC